MWASNFPVAGLKVSYKDQLDGMFKIMNGLSDYNLQKIFFRNAIDFYKIDIPSNY
jgi:predicted TIM-barrel fold metal-dependent hydrolase